MTWRQEFLSIETTATGPQLDRLVSGTGATEMHRHSSVNRWFAMPAPLNGWAIVQPCAYMIDSFGMIHLRGQVDGTAQTSTTVFQWPAVPDTLYHPRGFSAHVCASWTSGFTFRTAVLIEIGGILQYHAIPGISVDNPIAVDIGAVSYYSGDL